MSLVTVAEARAQIKTSLTDAQVQAILDREEAALVRVAGAHYVDGTTTTTQTLAGGMKGLYLRRPAASVDAIVEDGVTLDTDDYRLWGEQGRIERLPAGSIWGAVVVVEYVPTDDSDERKAAIIELARQAIERTALKGENIGGEYSYSAPEWEAERARLLRRLGFWRV